MLEAITTEMLLTSGILGVSALAAAGGLLMMRGPHSARKAIDIEALVRDAPYERLHNILSVKGA